MHLELEWPFCEPRRWLEEQDRKTKAVVPATAVGMMMTSEREGEKKTADVAL